MYCLAMLGSSMLRTKMDLLDAYAILSPLESDDRGVGEPRVVDGEAAQMASLNLSVSFDPCLSILYDNRLTS